MRRVAQDCGSGNMSTIQQMSSAYADAAPPDSELRSGSVLGRRYRIVCTLAAGGMATIYEAHDIPLERMVVLKVLRRELTQDPDIVASFLNEARSLARLHSLHVTRVLDCGNIHQAAAPDIPFIVLELLEGVDLWTILRHDSRLSEPVTAGYMLEACEGLAEVHALHIVHRDIKPENIFLANDLDGTHTIKLLDFGISKKPDSIVEEWQTQSNNVIGSPQYMSPEQMRAMPIDARSDIWSLGTVMFECVAGRPAFGGSTIFEISAQVLSDRQANLRTLNSELSESFVTIVERCLERDPTLRFQNVAELAQALEPFAVVKNVPPSVRIACLLGLYLPQPVLEGPVIEPIISSIDTLVRMPAGRASRAGSRWRAGLSGLVVVVTLLALWGYRNPKRVSRIMAETLQRTSSMVSTFSRL